MGERIDDPNALSVTGFAVIAISALSACSQGSPPNLSEVASTALYSTFDEELGGLEEWAASERPGARISICVETEVEFDFAAMGRAFSETPLVPVSAEECTTKDVPTDDPIFSHYIYHFDANGDAAIGVKISDVRCATSAECEVDIDHSGSGDTYHLERTGKTWTVTKREMRWVV
jgi:hypothetical protein